MGIRFWGRRLVGIGLSLFAFSQAIGTSPHFRCLQLLANGRSYSVASRAFLEPGDINDPLFFLKHQDTSLSFGTVITAFDETLGTRLYYGISEPNLDGSVPLVAKNAQSVVLYFHGSGTLRASGRNFHQKMQALIAAGVSPIGIDLPFHADGPVDSQFDDMGYFMEWLHSFIKRLKQSSKPIYMVGHSFGPIVIKEYMARYPSDIAGALLISDAGSYHPSIEWTFRNITAPGMRFIDPNYQAAENALGSAWSGRIDRQATWLDRPAPDGKLVFLRGTEDEWFPENRWLPERLGVAQRYAPRSADNVLRRKFPNAKFVFVPGVGHYLFDHKDRDGNDLIQALLFELMGIRNGFSFSPPVKTARMEIAQLYFTNPLFRAWIGRSYVRASRAEGSSQRALQAWRQYLETEWKEIFASIPEKYPNYYRARRWGWSFANTMMEKMEEQKGKGKPAGLPSEIKILRSDFMRYLEQTRHGDPSMLGEDPLRPESVGINAELLASNGRVTKWGFLGPVLLANFEAGLSGNGNIIRKEVLSDYAVKVTYKLEGKEKEYTATLFHNMSQDELVVLVQEAFLLARERARWSWPPAKWSGEARGVKMRGVQKEKMVTALEPIVE